MAVQTGWRKVLIWDYSEEELVATQVPIYDERESGFADVCTLWDDMGIARAECWECEGCQWLPEGVEL